MEQTIKTALEANQFELNEDIASLGAQLVAQEPNELNDIDCDTYIHTLYVMGKKYEGNDPKATRYVAMTMNAIMECMDKDAAPFDAKIVAFVANNRAFLKEKYAKMDKSLRKTSLINVGALGVITYFFMGQNIPLAVGVGILGAFVMYRMMGKRLNKKLDVELMKHYKETLLEDEMRFINQKVYF
ncbi:MAG: hypothetical protein ACRDBX_00555 [Erysipelotrichaceae bacterium]